MLRVDPAVGIEWVTLAWGMLAAGSLTLALIHLMVWARQTRLRVHLIFSVTALSATALVATEIWLLRSVDPQAYATALRWYHVPAFFVICSLVLLVRDYLKAGRLALAWAIIVIRLVSLVLNFTTGENLNYLQTTDLRWFTVLGQRIAGAMGTPNPWMVIGQISLVLTILFILDAAWTTWRRGERSRALYAGGAMILLIVSGTLQPILVFWGVVELPLLVAPFFAGVLGILAFALSGDIMRMVQLADQLREKEGEVRLSEERLELAADAGTIGLWSVDPATGAIWASERARRMYGVGAEEPVGLSELEALIHPDDLPAFRRALEAAVRGAAEFRQEYRIVRRDGSVRWMLARGRMMAGGRHGEAHRLFGASVDVTEAKASERRVAELSDQLDRTERMKVLGELSGTIAHELNQPLAGILNTAQAAEINRAAGALPDADLAEMLSDIIADTKRAAAVIRNLRDLYRDQDATSAPFSMREVIASCLHLLNSELVVRGVACRFDPQADPQVIGNRLQIQQVLINLIMNSAQAIERAGGAERTIAVRLAADADGCRVEVEDAGDGIPPDRLPDLFKGPTDSRSGGMGLGLSLCQRILVAHGGAMFAENLPSGGARVGFTLPRAPQME